MLPWNIPAGAQGIFVSYIGTFFPSSIWRTGTSAARRSLSKEKLHPIRKLTKSSCQSAETSVYSPTSSPFL